MNLEMEEDDSEEYGEGYMSGMGELEGSGAAGPAGPRRPTRGGSASDVMVQSQLATMSSLLSSVDLGALLAPASQVAPISAGPVLIADAEAAYRNGNYPLALELYFAHMVTEYEQARVSLQTIKYSSLLRRPVWHVRWGVSYAVRGATDVEDPQPIQEGKTPVNRMAAGGNQQGPPGSGAIPGYGEEPAMDMEMDMEDDSMEQQMASMPGYGDAPSPASARQTRSQPKREMLSSEAQQTFDKYLGLVATIVAEEFDRRYRQGDFGTALATVTVPEPVDPRARRAPAAANDEPIVAIAPMSQAGMDALDESAEPRPLWKPGILYYGEGDSKDITKMAKADGIDILLHFDVYLKPVRNEYVQNVSRCRLIRVTDGKSLVVSKGIDSVEAMAMARTGRGSERDYVMGQLESLLAIIDRYIVTTDLPKLTPEMAKRRVGSLLSGADAKSLRTLAEIRLYQMQQLLSAKEVATAFDIIGGEDALLMLYGPQSEKLAMARKWAVQAVSSAAQ